MASLTTPQHNNRIYSPAVVVALVALTIPFLLFSASKAIGTVPAFLPAFLACIMVLDLLTAVLLTAQYIAGGSIRLLGIAVAYWWAVVTVAAHALVFPGLFSATGLFGVTPSSSVWLWTAWHVGFPVFLAAATLPCPKAIARILEKEDTTSRRTASLVAFSIVTVLAAIPIIAVTVFAEKMPVILVNGDYSKLTTVYGPYILFVTVASTAVAIYGLWWKNAATALGAWASVAALAVTADVLVTLLARERFSFGWYGARVLALVASLVVLISLVEHIQRTYKQAQAHAQQVESINDALVVEKKAREQIIGVVSHEMKNPLTSLLGYIEILQEHSAENSDPVAQKMLTRCSALARSLGRLGDDLLTDAESEQGTLVVHVEEVNLKKALDWCSEQFPEADMHIKADENIRVAADPVRLQQILGNLVRNAIKYGQGPVVVTTRTVSDQRIEILVTDQGDGVPPDALDVLFEKYKRAGSASKVPGVGLGLAVSKELAVLQQGNLDYRPENKSFVLTLPLTASVTV